MRRSLLVALLVAACTTAQKAPPPPVYGHATLRATEMTTMLQGQTGRQPGRRPVIVEKCCVLLTWQFADYSAPQQRLSVGEVVMFHLAIDGSDHPEFEQTLMGKGGEPITSLRFSTVIPADLAFGHSLAARIELPTGANRMGNPAVKFAMVDQTGK